MLAWALRKIPGEYRFASPDRNRRCRCPFATVTRWCVPEGSPTLCRDKSARAARPRRATCQRIAATGANRAVVTALKNEGSGVLEGAAVDANLKDAAVKAVLKGVIVAEQ